MKHLLFAFIAISMLVISCTKQEEFPSTSYTKINQTTDRQPSRHEITIGWEEWGRKKYDCDRNGLCRFKIGYEENNAIQVDEAGNLFVDILIDDTYPTQYGIEVFPVDEDITSTFEEVTYRMRAGQYPLNPELGSMGGYRVPLFTE